MTRLTLELQNDVAAKFNNLMQVFTSKELLFEKFFDYHVKKLKREIAAMQQDLDTYERLYNKKSSEFYSEFEQGKLDDSEDFILWSGIYEMQMNCKRKLQKLL